MERYDENKGALSRVYERESIMGESKKEIRNRIRRIRESMSCSEIEEKSLKITEKTAAQSWFSEAQTVMSYISIKNEIDTSYLNRKIVESGKKLLFPVIENEEIKAVAVDGADYTTAVKKFGVIEPENGRELDKNEIDLVIVPGVAFDREGNRIGFGKGYYDRFLKGYRGKKAALCYDFQIVEKIESEEHDEKVDIIISEI